MASGAASGMPNGERIHDRAFAYTEYAQLMTALGTVPDGVSTPEPSTIVLFGAGFVFLLARRKV